MIDWDKLNKINVRELTDAQTKHLVCKALIVQRLLIKYHNKKQHIQIYTEVPIENGRICDVYFSNNITKECIAYEIQSNVSAKWLVETKKIYANWEVYNMTTDLVIIRLDELSDNINILKGELDKLIV